MLLRCLQIFAVLALCLGTVQLRAQEEVLMGVRNEPVTITFLSAFEPYISQDASRGEISLVESPRYNYTLTYLPDLDFVGIDEFLLVSFPFGYNVRFTTYRIDIREADIRANHDQASTLSGSPVTVPVMANDYTNTGQMTLTAIPVVNGGTAAIVGDQISFTPNPGFVGLTDLNYVICTGGTTCDLGTVTIDVAPAPGSLGADTIRVFTKRDQPQFIFTEPGATPLASPVNGVTNEDNGVMTYQPDAGFVGDERLVYANPVTGSTTVFDVTVLDLEDNEFAVEDRAYTPVDAPVTFNLLHNDIYTIFAGCVELGSPRYGTVNSTGLRGQVEYTPLPGWSGVDQFTYSSRPPGCNGPAEEATVYVFVSDFAPGAGVRKLHIPAGTALPITYEVPNGSASWRLQTSPQHGAVNPGPNGQLLYSATFDQAGESDHFRIRYCLNGATGSECVSVPVEVMIGSPTNGNGDCQEEDCVWPGDTNRDGVVDVSDLLPIGLATGKFGTPRPSADPTVWTGQYAEDWGVVINGVDLKHADANGDHVISALDTQVVMANLGRAYRLHPEAQTFTTFELNLKGPATAEPGDLVVFEIVTGNNTVIVEDVYGFRFPFPYSTTGVVPASVNVQFDEGDWISYDSPILSLVTNDEEVGLVETAVTRTNLLPVSGYGKIGTLSAVIVEDVYGFFRDPDAPAESNLTFGGGTGTATTAAGHANSVKINPVTIRVSSDAATDLSEHTAYDAQGFLDRHLMAFPNPTGGQLTVHLNGQQRFTELRLSDLMGRIVLHKRYQASNHTVLDLNGLPAGVYTLSLTTPAGVVNRAVHVE